MQTKQTEYLTSGHKDVTSILRIVAPDSSRSNNTVIYYMSTREDKPGERHVYSVEVTTRKMPLGQYESHLKGSRLYRGKTNHQCYTCDQIELNQCLYNRVSFSTKASYFVHECLGPEIPYSTLRRMDNLTNSAPWLNNDPLKVSLENKLLPTVRTELINATDYSKYMCCHLTYAHIDTS